MKCENCNKNGNPFFIMGKNGLSSAAWREIKILCFGCHVNFKQKNRHIAKKEWDFLQSL